MPLRLQEICQLASGGGQELVAPLPPTLPLFFAGLTTLQFASNGPVCGSVWGGLAAVLNLASERAVCQMQPQLVVKV